MHASPRHAISSIPALASIAAILVLTAAASADVTFSDTQFVNSNWGSESVVTGTATSVGTQASGGNPGFARQVTNTLSTNSSIFGFNRYGTTTATRYEPATSGAILTVDFSIDAKWLSGFGGQGHGISLGAKQGTIVFRAAYDITGSTGLWQTHATSGLTAADFIPLTGNSLIDFSATGAPIRFGFIASNGSTNESYTNVVLYDNFNVVVHTVPGPAAAGLLGLGGLVVARRRRASC